MILEIIKYVEYVVFVILIGDQNNLLSISKTLMRSNKGAKMALNRSPEFKGVAVQIVCVVEIQFESAWALTNVTSDNTYHASFHASEKICSEEYD